MAIKCFECKIQCWNICSNSSNDFNCRIFTLRMTHSLKLPRFQCIPKSSDYCSSLRDSLENKYHENLNYFYCLFYQKYWNFQLTIRIESFSYLSNTLLLYQFNRQRSKHYWIKSRTVKHIIYYMLCHHWRKVRLIFTFHSGTFKS